MIVVSGKAQPTASAFSKPAQRDPSSLITTLTVRAEKAFETARAMIPGGERAAAIRKAMMLANAAELLRHFSGTPGAPAK